MPLVAERAPSGPPRRLPARAAAAVAGGAAAGRCLCCAAGAAGAAPKSWRREKALLAMSPAVRGALQLLARCCSAIEVLSLWCASRAVAAAGRAARERQFWWQERGKGGRVERELLHSAARCERVCGVCAGVRSCVVCACVLRLAVEEYLRGGGLPVNEMARARLLLFATAGASGVVVRSSLVGRALFLARGWWGASGGRPHHACPRLPVRGVWCTTSHLQACLPCLRQGRA